MAGVFAFVVQGRAKEIGIRMALRARRRQVIALVLGSAARALAVGLLVGYIGAAALARLMSGFLFGVSSFDVLIYFAAGLFRCLGTHRIIGTWYTGGVSQYADQGTVT
jgi:hypothetical protein